MKIKVPDRLVAGALIGSLILVSGFAVLPETIAVTDVSETLSPKPVSTCQAIAGLSPGRHVQLAAGTPLERNEVRLSYIGHSTYQIETPQGVRIVTDYNGYVGQNPPPTVATMNKAHGSHFTLQPDPNIEHVLPGWNPNGGSIDYNLVVGDTYIRNVTTDIRSGFGGAEPDANSIFIFEVAGLCIGHLGHLHHELDDSDFAQIGRLDVLMVPIDGGLTIGQKPMSDIVKRLRSSIILPMHRRGASIASFIDLFGSNFASEFRRQDNVTVSLRNLPKQPTIIVLDGV